ncbi:MAG: hypothetical protein ACK4PG_11525 [Acetobacteraceae bacterium]
MEAFFASGLVADIALGVLALEAAALWALRRFAGRGPGLAPLGLGLLSGACLLLALRAALTGAGPAWIGAALAAAGAAQVAWLVQASAAAPSAHAGRRTRGRDSPPGPG